MPPRRQQSKPVGPFDLRTRKLPGGTEMEAIATGIILGRARGEGYGMAAKLANRNTVADATKQQPWFIGDVKTGLLRSQNAPQLFATFPEMEEIFTHDNSPGNITAQEFARGNAWKKVLDIAKNQPLTGSFADLGKHYVSLREGVFLTHRLEYNDIAPVETEVDSVSALTIYSTPQNRLRRRTAYSN